MKINKPTFSYRLQIPTKTGLIVFLLLCVISCSKTHDPAPTNGSLTINIDNNYIDSSSDPSFKMWVMVSDLSGNIIGVEQVLNGKKISIAYPNSFNDDHVYLTQFSGYVFGGHPSCYATSSLVPRISEFNFARTNVKAILGSSKISVTNFTTIPSTYDYTLAGGGTKSSTFTSSNILNIEMGHYKTPDDLFISITPQNESIPHYKWINGVEINKEYSVDFTTFETMTTGPSITVPANDNLYFIVQGFKNISDYQGSTLSYNSFADHRTSFTPYVAGNTFSSYATTIQLHTGNELYEICKVGALPTSFTAPSFGVVIDKKDPSDFSIRTNPVGDYDVATISFSNTDNTFSWTVNNPETSTFSGALPAVPSQVSNSFSVANKSSLAFTQVGIRAYDDISDYDDYIKHTIGSYWYSSEGYTTLSKTGN